MSAKACKCSGPRTFDPNVRGQTCGGLWLIGWDRCDACGRYWLAEGKRGRPCDAPTWELKSRSVEIGTGRIRFGAIKVDTAESLDVQGLMRRIARLPDLERALHAIAESGGEGAAIARAALGVEP